MKKIHMALMAIAIVALPATAKDDPAKINREKLDQQAASAALARGEILPIVRLLGFATAKVPGDVLKVKLERKTAGFQYEVKILARNGRVREVKLDARNGHILSIEDD
jgi:uncharacterized membrane protein YkoI